MIYISGECDTLYLPLADQYQPLVSPLAHSVDHSVYQGCGAGNENVTVLYCVRYSFRVHWCIVEVNFISPC